MTMSDLPRCPTWTHTRVSFRRECRRNHDARWTLVEGGLETARAVCKMGCGGYYFHIARNEYNAVYLICKKCGNPSGLPLGIKPTLKKRRPKYEND